MLLKWNNSTNQKSSIPLLQPFSYAFSCHNLNNGQESPTMTKLCRQAAYLRSIKLRRLKLADVILSGDVRLAHEQLGLVAFAVNRPKNDKG